MIHHVYQVYARHMDVNAVEHRIELQNEEVELGTWKIGVRIG